MFSNNFLKLPMFKDKKKVEGISKIVQCNFYDCKDRNVLDSIGGILNILSKEITKHTPEGKNITPKILKSDSYPFSTIAMDNISMFDFYVGFLDGFKMNDSLLWNKWKYNTSFNLIADFSKSLMEFVNVERMVRLGFLSIYKTKVDNLKQNELFAKNLKFEPLEASFKIDYKDYNIKLVIQKIDNENLNILWDVAYNKLLTITDYKKFLLSLLKEEDIEMIKFLNKQK